MKSTAVLYSEHL